MNSPQLEIRNLSFSYKNEAIFKDLNIKLSGDQLVGVIGVNGSGKSTLLKLLLGLLKVASGEVLICGHRPQEKSCRHMVGAALQDIDFPNSERVLEVLKFIQAQYPNPQSIEPLIEDFFLKDFIHKPCGQLSGGMKRRLALACALLGKPQVLLLDEPSTGLDFPSRRQLINNLKKYQVRDQALVIMISHHPEDILQKASCFWHVKNGGIQTLSPEEMASWTQLKKVSFQSGEQWAWGQAHKQGREGRTNWYVVHDSDALVSELIKTQQNFQNLVIEPMGTDEILGEIL